MTFVKADSNLSLYSSRERVVQELRRNGIQPPVMISDYAGGARSYSPIRSRSRSPGRSFSPGRSRSRSRSPGVRFHSSVVDNSPINNSSRRSYLDDDYTSTTPKASYTHDVL